jgi:putative ABC transport system ATP-binding protein
VSLPLSYQWISGSERNNRAIEALKRVWLGDKIYNKPNELSGWQQQRVAIARAIVANPSVMQILSELHAEWKTILLITHDANIAKYAKRTIRIKDGLIDTDN